MGPRGYLPGVYGKERRPAQHCVYCSNYEFTFRGRIGQLGNPDSLSGRDGGLKLGRRAVAVEHPGRGFQHHRLGAVVGRERHKRRGRVVLRELQEESPVCATKSVNGLIRVAYGKKALSARTAQKPDQLVLGPVAILELVHQ